MRTTILLIILLLGGPARVSAQALKPEKPTHPIMAMVTDHGTVYIELFPEEAPKTVANFIGLATGKKEFTDLKTKRKVKRRFYDGRTFHRVIKGFMVQGGCPKGDGTGGPGYQFEDEISATSLGLHKIKVLHKDGRVHPALMVRTEKDFYSNVVDPLLRRMGFRDMAEAKARAKEIDQRLKALTVKEALENLGYRYKSKLRSRPLTKGVLAMANAGPNTNGSQFFINLVDTPHLVGRHTVFGKVLAGMDVVDKIGGLPVGPGSQPVKPVKIISLKLHRKGKTR